MSRASLGPSLLLALLSLTGACQDSRSPCQLALDEERYEAAKTLCREEYAAGGPSEILSDAASGAARAHYFLGEFDAVFAWAARAAGTDAEARILALTAGIHAQRGEEALERQALERSLSLFLDAQDWGRAAWSQHGLAYRAWQESRYRDALEQAQEAEDLALRGGDEELQRLARELQYSVLYAIGDLGAARQTLDRARPFLDGQPPIFSVRWHHHHASLLLDRGRPLLAKTEELQALALLDQAVDSYGEDPLLVRSVHLNLVEISLRLGELEEAQRHLDAAWMHEESRSSSTALLFFRARVAEGSGHFEDAARDLRQALAADPVADWVWELELLLGQVLEDLGEPTAAEDAYRRSVAGVETLRSSLGLDDLKPWLLEKKRRPFEALFLLLVSRDRGAEALEVAEAARARSLVDSLVQTLTADPPVSEGAAERELPSADTRLALLESWTSASQQAPERLPVGTFLESLRRHTIAVFFEAGENLWRLDSKEDVLQWRQLPWTTSEVEDKVQTFLAAVDQSALAAELGEGLLPLDALSSSSGSLYLLPDGPLTLLPFAALRIEGRPILDRFSLSYLPSLTSASSETSSHEGSPPPRNPGDAGTSLVIGDPRGTLPAARREAVQVAELLEPSSLLIGPEANLQGIKKAGPIDCLHLATHTGLGPGGAWVELAGGPVPATELLAATGPPRLAVLASCASAARPGREVAGSLAAAFLGAGTTAVLGTLRSVDDSQAREVILRFYRHGGRSNPAEALARAQRSLAAEGYPPSFWAPFLILGNSIHSEPSTESLE